MTTSEPTRCGGRFIVDFVEHSSACVRCANAVLEGDVQCTVCGLALKKKDMNRHMRLHSAEKPYRCARCSEAFTRKQNLSTHLRRHTNERPFACTACGKAFRQEQTLWNHRAVHSAERPFACCDCASTFKLKQDLTTHKHRVHGYHYTCRRCPAEFAKRKELVAHYHQHHKAGPLKESN